jgi:ABC-type multidrug transport system ATPase subunit
VALVNVIHLDPQKAVIKAPIAIPASGGILIGRTGGMVDLTIDHPSVSLRHAKIFRRGDRVYAVDLRSFSGTFVDGVRVWTETQLPIGSRLAIGPAEFTFDGTSLSPYADALGQSSLVCTDVGREVRGHAGQASVALLSGISLAIREGELVCLIGPSGSGKSTLLSMLSGQAKPDSGSVLYRGRNLHRNFESLKHDIAAVPQREAIHQPLTTRQALYYATALRSPSDTSHDELTRRVDRLLAEVGLRDRGDVRVRDLSGGQLRRVGLACEIAHQPGLILLDEVTSGLDELGDLELMQLARSLASAGRSIVCITHNTLNIERTAHRVVVLAPGGHLACVGTPREVCAFFRITRLGDTYASLARKPGAEWASTFRGHALWQRHVAPFLPRPASVMPSSEPPRDASDSRRRPLRLAGQVRLLTARSLLLQAMDPRAAVFAITQAVFVSILLVTFFGDLDRESPPVVRLANCRNAAFLLLVSAFWLGCNNAAAEIAKERTLFERERAVSIGPTGYFISKLIVLGTIAVLQALLVFTALSWLSHLPGEGGLTGCIRSVAVVSATGILGTIVGLAISATATSEQVAIRAVPMLMIPQIVLADVLTPLEGWLERFAPALITTFWTFRAFCAGTADYLRPGQPLEFPGAAGMMAVHGAFAVSLAVAGLRRKSA